MNDPTIILFEDDSHTALEPASATRPVWDIRCGALSNKERLIWQLPGADFLGIARPYMLEATGDRAFDPQLPGIAGAAPLLLLNGAVRFDRAALQRLLDLSPPLNPPREPEGRSERLFTSDGRVVAARLNPGTLKKLDRSPDAIQSSLTTIGLPSEELPCDLTSAIWQVIPRLADRISQDLELLPDSRTWGALHPLPDVFVRNPHQVFCAPDVQVGAGTVIDASHHPVHLGKGVELGCGCLINATQDGIYLDDSVIVEDGAMLAGPAFIGSGSIIRRGAQLGGGIALGEQCRVGGELSTVVMQGLSNKQHSGYLGNSWIGSWVNLGAATDTSDLKNNYGAIELSIGGRSYPTGETHLGTFIGDFTRTAIHTRLNTGTVVGVCCNLFGADFPPRDIPPFTWLSSDGAQEYRIDKALETIAKIMPRRGKDLTPAIKTLLQNIFERSAERRAQR